MRDTAEQEKAFHSLWNEPKVTFREIYVDNGLDGKVDGYHFWNKTIDRSIESFSIQDTTTRNSGLNEIYIENGRELIRGRWVPAKTDNLDAALKGYLWHLKTISRILGITK
jgi:hypothetical protein